jgi:hypothetical protein
LPIASAVANVPAGAGSYADEFAKLLVKQKVVRAVWYQPGLMVVVFDRHREVLLGDVTPCGVAGSHLAISAYL